MAMAKRAARKRAARASRDNTTWLIVGGIGAVVVVGLLLVLNANLGSTPTNGSASKVWGRANAPVTIELYSDLQ